MTKKMKTLSLIGSSLLVAVFFAIGCGGDKHKAEIQKLKAEAISVHDEIMPEVNTFNRHTVKIEELLTQMDSLHTANPALDTASLRVELTELKSKLESANDQMMQWMADYDADPEGKNSAELKAYYESEVEKIKQLRTVFNEVSEESSAKLANF